MIDRLMRAGMDVARLNFSHGTQAEHAATVKLLRAASGRHQRPIAILADMPGPKIRTGALEGGQPVLLRAGQRFTISTVQRAGDRDGVSTTYKPLPSEVRRGDRILLADGLIELRVESSRRHEIVCRVVNGGMLGEHKGVNLPGVKLRVPALTPKDLDDLAFALRCGVNYIGVSFVRSAEDVLAAKAAVARAGKSTPIIAKLEKPEAIENLDAILRVADGVMVARGDLGVEMSPERVPVVQKMRDRARPRSARPGDHRHADARVDDRKSPAHARRGLRRGQRHLRRQRRADALGRNRHGPLPGRDRADDGPHHSRGRSQHGQRSQPPPQDGHEHRRRHRRTDLPRLRRTGDEGHRRLHRNRLDRAAHFQVPVSPAGHRLLAQPGHAPADFAALGSDAAQDADRCAASTSMAAHAERRLLEEGLVRRGDIVGIVAGMPFGVGGTTNFMKFHVVGSVAR